MSGNALTWARAQLVGDGYAKALLKEYAHWASEDYSTWASNPTLIASLEMDIKTIRRCRDKLVELGFLIETKRRSGGTGNIVVYQMVAPAGSTVVQSVDRRSGETVSLSPPSAEEYLAKQDQKRTPFKSGTPKGNQKRSPSKNGAPPDVDARGTKNGAQGGPDFPEGGPNLVPDFSELGSELSEGVNAGGEDAPNTPSPADKKSQTQTEGTRIHPDWKPTDEQVAQAIADQPAWDAAEVARQARKFRNHWLSKPGDSALRTNWDLTWENWVLSHDPSKDRAAGGAPAASGDGGPWYEGAPEVIEARGAELGVRPRKPDEPIASYRVLVVKASREKAAVDFVLRDARRFNSQQLFDFAVATFGDELMPVDFYAS